MEQNVRLKNKRVRWKKYAFNILDNVYEPAEDTFLLAENLTVKSGNSVLDMGTGCGILAVISAQKAKSVVAVDINPYAVRCTKINGRLNGVDRKMYVIRGDLFGSFRINIKFDLIVFNAPYLPVKRSKLLDWIDYAWAGGDTGRAVIDQFILSAPRYLKAGGHILLIQSTLSGVTETLQKLKDSNLKASIADKEKTAFETITLIKAERL